MHTPMTITKGEDFTAIGYPTEWYRGYKLEQFGGNVNVLDMSGERPRVVWGEYVRCDDECGWDRCRNWIDAKLGKTPFVLHGAENPVREPWKTERDMWLQEVASLSSAR